MATAHGVIAKECTNKGRTLLIDLNMVERTRDELYRQYEAEVDLYERFGTTNIISFDEWLDIKRYCKNETKAGI